MQTRNIFLRISKFIGKAIAGLLLVLFAIVILVHIPPVQRRLTPMVSDYLSAKIKSRVEIKRIKFSVLGDVSIEGLAVWDPEQSKIFSAENIVVSSNITDLITGNLIFDEIRLSGIEGHVIQYESGLNIQFIIEAFQPEKKEAPTEGAVVNIQFNKIYLDNILFEFNSTTSGTNAGIKLGSLMIHGAGLSTSPMKIVAEKINLKNTAVNVLITTQPDTVNHLQTLETTALLSPDFGTEIIFEVGELEFKDDDFSFHRNTVTNPAKFDASHIDLKDIDINLTGIIIHQDTLAAVLKHLSAGMPGFQLTDAGTVVRMNRDAFFISGLHVASGSSNFRADLTGPVDLRSAKGDHHVPVVLTAKGRINPGEFSYFLSDTVMNYFNGWESTDLELEARYSAGKGAIKVLSLKSGNSQLFAEGLMNDVFDPEKINWKDVQVSATIGSAFRQTLTPFLRPINIPPDAAVRVRSSGSPKRIIMDGKVHTSWGDAEVTGLAAQQAKSFTIDVNLIGRQVNVGKWIDVTLIGPVDLSADAKGIIGSDLSLEIDGLISSMELLNEPIHSVDFQSKINNTSVNTIVSIEDPKYRSDITSDISFAGPLEINTVVQLDSFSVGSLLQLDSSLSVSGGFRSNINIDHSSLNGYVEGQEILFRNLSTTFKLDTLSIQAMISPARSTFNYLTDDGNANLESNFDIREAGEVFQTWTGKYFKQSDHTKHLQGNRALQFTIQLGNAIPFQLLDIDVNDFSSINVTGAFDEQEEILTLQATAGNFKGFGVSLDTLSTRITASRDSVNGSLQTENMFYKATEIGDLELDMFAKGDTTTSRLLLSNDSVTLLGLRTRLFATDSGIYIFPDQLQLLEYQYSMDPKNPVYLDKVRKNIVLDRFLITQDSMRIFLDGNLNAFEINLRNGDLTHLNYLLSRDTTIIDNGRLNGDVSYSQDQQLNIQATIDSLSLYNSNPFSVTVTAVRNDNQVPFEFHLTNEANKIDLNGEYFLDDAEIDASLLLDVQNLELFAFLLTGVFEKMHGALKGETHIHGPIQTPTFDGTIRIVDAGFTTVNPKLNFNVKDDVITIDNSSLKLDDFKLYDEENNPLTINGNVTSKDFESFSYDLHITTDRYTLINRPDSSSGPLRGILVIGTDIKLTGTEKDTQVDAKIIIKDTTALSYVASSDDVELLKSEGIVDFIDPALLLDTLGHAASTYYDSLIASLPDFNLNSTVTIEDNASLRVIINEQSGDFLEASGGANLELGFDRTGNVRLSGTYTIKKGVYRLSFYDLVKKNFTLAPGSSITWNGSPENGDLSIRAVYTVSSNSIGLIGHEIGENEKAIYKRTLNYEVGININGTIEEPVITFSLDLPQVEKTNYPVLANKLDRLRQPEYASELNKQVFGLLVLGGFLPETSGADINQNLIATTALSNSVNSLLASQLNRFASQYIKGVNIDVGLQSYSDYSAPGGKTRTSMDFRVSKRIMNDRLSFEVGGDFDINQDQSGTNTGDNFRGDVAIIYDLTGNGDKQIKVFNNETYDIIYQEIRNTGISLVFIREFDRNKKDNSGDK